MRISDWSSDVCSSDLAGEKLVILDSRPMDEYHKMNIPGGIDVPGAELVYRVRDLAPDPDTLVVVNCAGRTRSIIGCQSLINAGLPNKVVRSEEHTSELQSLMRISYAVFCLKKKKNKQQ